MSSDFRDEQAIRFNVKVNKGSRGSVKKGLGISLVEVYEGHGNLSLQSVKGPKRANKRILMAVKNFLVYSDLIIKDCIYSSYLTGYRVLSYSRTPAVTRTLKAKGNEKEFKLARTDRVGVIGVDCFIQFSLLKNDS